MADQDELIQHYKDEIASLNKQADYLARDLAAQRIRNRGHEIFGVEQEAKIHSFTMDKQQLREKNEELHRRIGDLVGALQFCSYCGVKEESTSA